MRTASVCQALAVLTAQNRVHKTAGGHQLVSSGAVSPNPVPATAYQSAGNGNG
jgi:hypothetical protein